MATDRLFRHRVGRANRGIVGFGRIGQQVARRLTAFDMNILAHDPYVHVPGEGPTRLIALDELLAACDVLTVHVPKTPQTTGLIGARELSLMKPSAHIVNTARGGIIDENALAAVLRDGRLAGAALDVFATEPPGASPLLKLPNVVATPHLGAGTSDAKFRAGEEASHKVLAELEAVFAHGQAEPGARTSPALRATHSPTLTCTAQSQADRRAE